MLGWKGKKERMLIGFRDGEGEAEGCWVGKERERILAGFRDRKEDGRMIGWSKDGKERRKMLGVYRDVKREGRDAGRI